MTLMIDHKVTRLVYNLIDAELRTMYTGMDYENAFVAMNLYLKTIEKVPLTMKMLDIMSAVQNGLRVGLELIDDKDS